jgi:hypothetical protein
MYWWMALNSLFWCVVVVGIIYFLNRRIPGRPGGETVSAITAGTGSPRHDEGDSISDEEVERMRERLSR